MGTTMIFSIVLLTATVTSTLSATTTIPPTTTIQTTTSTAAPPAATIEDSITAKSKREIFGIGSNIWTDNGAHQTRQDNVGLSEIAAQDRASPAYSSTSGFYSPSVVAQANSYPNQVYAANPQGQSSRVSLTSAPKAQDKAPGYKGYYSSPVQNPTAQATQTRSGYQASPAASSARQSRAQSQTSNQARNDSKSNVQYMSPAEALQLIADKQHLVNPIRTTFIPYSTIEGQHTINKPHTYGVPVAQYAPQHQTALAPQEKREQQAFSSVNLGSIPIYSNLAETPLYDVRESPLYTAASQLQQNTVTPAYTTNYPIIRNAEMYAPQYQSASNFAPALRSYEKPIQGASFNEPTVEFNGKKVPLPLLQLQSAQEFPGFVRAIENQPLLLDGYQPDLSYLNIGAKPGGYVTQAANSLPFLSPAPRANQQVVQPVQSSSSTPQFPQYKGASIEAFPSIIAHYSKPSNDYQALKTQPQLHFAPKPSQSVTREQSTSHYSKPSEDIKTDTEVIKKKKKPPPPPSSHEFSEDDLEEGYKAIEREYGQFSEDDDDSSPSSKSFKETDSEGGFQASKSYPFRSYDEKFGKYSEQASSPVPSEEAEEEEEAAEEKPYYAQYSYNSAQDDDEDFDGHSTRNHEDYTLPEPRRSKYREQAESEEEEDEEGESRRQERQEEAEEEDDYSLPKRYKATSDFEEEFENSYKKELPVYKYVHRKEVPEVNEPTSHSHKSPKRTVHKGSKTHTSRDKDSSGHGSASTQHYHKIPKTYKYHKDNEGHSSRSFTRRSPKTVHEESYGYKRPGSEQYSSSKKSPKKDSYVRSTKSSYQSDKPKDKDNGSYENGDSYSFSSGSSWKGDENAPPKKDSYGYSTSGIRSLAQPDPKLNRDTFRYSNGNSAPRDLTGI